ncbi:hypothetical protein AK88_00940, partial [Plasmodium fragile]
YFAHLAKRRRTYRTVRDVPSPPLDEEILEHLQRGELPPHDYGYTMIRDRRPASAAERRGQRPPHVNRRTIIELHLEVLNECEAAAWDNVKDDYLHILVEQFARDLERDPTTCISSSDFFTPNDGAVTHHSTTDHSTTDDSTTDYSTTLETLTRDQPMDSGSYPSPPNEDDPDPWSCMETIQLQTDPCAPNEDDPDPCSCMENIQLDTEPDPHFSPRNECATPDHTNWITWIDRNRHLLQDCTTQPWFLQLKAEWKKYLRDHMAATVPMKKLDLWRQWVAQQHDLMNIYGEEEWFQHLLENIEEQTVPENGEVPGVEKDVEVDHVMTAEDILIVRDLPESQPLHEQYYNKKHLIAKLWMLLLASVIEDCELERSMQETELYVDDLLQKL